jgi:hypothetical protein
MKIFTWIINIFNSKKTKKNIISKKNIKEDNLNNIISQTKKTPDNIVLNDSKRRINLFKIYSNYFNHKLINDILFQTECLHEMFEKNPNLNLKKLEQYHYYYTDHLLTLLEKIKKATDEKYTMLNSQILAISNKIETTKKEIAKFSTDKNIFNKKSQYNEYISLQLSSIYNCLIDNFDDFRYKNLNNLFTFTSAYSPNIYGYNIPKDIFEKIICNNNKNTDYYTYNDYKIHRKLMGKIQKNLFHIEFIDIFYSDKNTVEVFKIKDTNDYFIFYSKEGYFDFVDYEKILKKYHTKDFTSQGQFEIEIESLILRQSELLYKRDNLISVDDNVKESLKTYLHKIEDIEFLNNLVNVDLELQNLKTMLNATVLEI